MATTYKTVTLRSLNFVQDEAVASGAITPGMLVERTTAAVATVRAHATASGVAARTFAIEDELQGKTYSQAYSDGDRVQYRTFQPGDRVQALLADGYNYTVGTKLVSNADGYLKPYTAVDVSDSGATDVYTGNVVAQVDEARDLLTSGSTDPNTCPVTIL